MKDCVAELMAMAAYLLNADDPCMVSAEEIIPALCVKVKILPSHLRLSALRRELITQVISLKQRDLEDAQSLYKSRSPSPSGVLDWRLDPVEYSWSWLQRLSPAEHTVLHRLVLLMMLREGYSLRDCAGLLKSNDAVIQFVFDESVRLL